MIQLDDHDAADTVALLSLLLVFLRARDRSEDAEAYDQLRT